MNKKGKTNIVPWVILAVVLVIGGFVYAGKLGKSGTIATTTGGGAVACDTANPTVMNLAVKAQDQESSTLAQVAATLYVKQTTPSGQGSLIADAKTLSASADTSVKTATCNKLDAVAFDTTYYGDDTMFDVTGGTTNLILPVHTIGTATAGIEDYTNNNKNAHTSVNLSIAANGNDCFTISLKNPTANSEFRFKGIGVNLSTATNIQDVKASGGLVLASNPRRLNNNVKYYFQVPQYISIKQTDNYKSIGSICFYATGSNPAEAFSLIVVDQSKFKSVATATANQILDGVETDASTPADVGATDVVVQGTVQ